MYGFEIRAYVDCTYQEKCSCLEVIDTMVMLAHTTRIEGVLALEECMNETENGLLKTGILLVVDGTDPVLVQGILHNTVIFSHKTGAELIKQLIIAEGVLSIQAGDNPRIIEEKLKSFLGEDFIAEHGCNRPSHDSNPTGGYASFLKRMESIKPSDIEKESSKFEKLLYLSNRDIQVILREVDVKTLCIALKGTSLHLQKHFFSNMSIRLADMILEDMEYMGSVRVADAEYAQQEILNTIYRLQDMGEIITLRT